METKKLKVTVMGVILALKDIGTYLATFQVAQIKVDPISFYYGLGIFILMNVPSDLFLANHYSGDKNVGKT